MTGAASPEDRLSRLEAQLTDLQDREKIRDVIHRYCRAVDRCDLESFKACYWPDALDDHGFFGGNAHAFADYVIPILRQINSSVHAMTNTIIDKTGNKAFCETQWSVVHRLKDGEGFLDFWHQGRYIDVFEKRGDEWRISVRTIVSDMDRLLRTKNIRAMIAGASDPGAEEPSRVSARHPNDPVFLGAGIAGTVRANPGAAEFWAMFYGLAKLL